MQNRYILITLLLVFTIIEASAQKHRLFADVGTAIRKPFPGFSVTYNYKFDKQLSAGAGIQGYKISPSMTNISEFTPAAFADIRYDFAEREKGHFFSFLDIGISLYKHNNKIHRWKDAAYKVPHDNGFYTGLGVGYLHKMTARGSGVYACLKMVTNIYRPDAHDFVSEAEYVSMWMNGTFIASVGFRL